jgi:hypothetical protein
MLSIRRQPNLAEKIDEEVFLNSGSARWRLTKFGLIEAFSSLTIRIMA